MADDSDTGSDDDSDTDNEGGEAQNESAGADAKGQIFPLWAHSLDVTFETSFHLQCPCSRSSSTFKMWLVEGVRRRR